MQTALSSLSTFLPTSVDLLSMLTFLCYLAAGVLLVSLTARVVIGRKSALNHSISAAMGILCIYAVTVVIYTFNPYALARFLTPLPFVRFHGEVLQIFYFSGNTLPAICREILSMIILAFLVNLLDTWMPKGKKVLGWYIYRFITVALAMALHYGVTWVFNTYLPGVLVTYAPMILLGILIGLMALGLANVILSVILTVVNPIIGAIYAFFFSNIIGKQISKALVTTAILSAVVFALNSFGYNVISISASALMAYLPMIGVSLILWYIIGHKL